MICIVDYGVGNLASIKNMFKKAGVSSIISGDQKDILDAQKILLPGMGHFDNCMKRFNNSGLRPLIEDRVFNKRVPLLGICVGLQMFMESSEEGEEAGLGWINGKVRKFDTTKMATPEKVPNMGWLDVELSKNSVISDGLDKARFYFAHSYHVVPENEEVTLFKSIYGYPFCASIEKDNILGVQFHPEKSHRFGMKLLTNFATKFNEAN
jgi:imidazole glycerol-phosphate synthase subunit HisH